jgi:uncharacterized repeat protein (TIGR01451 family)
VTNFAVIGSQTLDTNAANNVSAPAITAVTNRPPVAVNDFAGTPENIPVTVHVLANDSDPDGDPLTIVSISPTNGTANISGTNVVFAPATNFVGIAYVGYTITDGFGGTNSALVTISVTNRPPVANPDSYAVAENTTNTFAVLTNDLVITPGGSLTIISVNPTNGVANILNGTNIVFTPTNNFLGTTTIGYSISDNVGGTNSSIVTVLVTNIPPVANPDSYAVTENTTNTFAVLTNDLVVTPGGSLTIITVSPTNGIANILNGTNIVFTPTNNFLGTTTIGYTITDGIGGTNSSIVTVLVTNIPPLANPDSYIVPENSTNTLSPLTNDMLRTPGGVLSIISANPTNGTATIVGGTNVTFTPANNFIGTTTIGYTIIDGIGGTNSSLITVLVTNIPPTAFGQSLTTTENTALPVALTGSDPTELPLTFVIVSSPAHGTLTGLNTNTGAVTYTPANNFTGADSFIFRVNNGYSSSSNATVSIAVTPVADLLVQESGPASGVAGSNLVFTVAVTNLGPANATNVVVTNQIDPGFTFFSASSSGAPSGNFVTWTIPVLPANHGTNFTVTLFAVEGGTFTNVASGGDATPDLNAANNNGSQTNAQVVTMVSALADVVVFKTGGTNALAGSTVNYFITATNAGPSTASNVVVQDELPAGVTLQTVSGNYSVSNNFIIWAAADLPGGTATNYSVALTAPAGGILTNVAFSTSDTPDPDSTNNNGSSSNSIVRTPLTPVADLAVGKSGAAASYLGANFSYTISVTNFGPSAAANLSVTDNLPAGLAFSSALPNNVKITGSQIVWTNLGTFAANAVTNLTLNVTVTSRGIVTNFASAGSPTLDTNTANNVSTPVVTAVTNRPPVAVNDFAGTPKNVAVTVHVLANDSDPDGDPLTIVSVSPTNGTAIISGTNVVFTPTNNFTGTATASYTITDGFGGTNSALIFVLVTNRPPVANNQNVTTTENVSAAITLTGSDPDGDALTFAIASGPTNGVLGSLNTNTGAVAYSPDTNFVGTDSFTFFVNDGTTNSGLATVSISVASPTPADIAVFKKGPASGVAGSNLVYTITVTNLGPSAATNILVSDQLPAGFAFVSATPAAATVLNNLVSWPAFNLADKGKTNFTVTAISADGGNFTNVAFAATSTFDPNPTNNNGSATNSQSVTVVTPRADVAVFKAGGTNIVAGGTVTYTITATNSGPSTASNVVVQDDLPGNVTFQTASTGYSLSNNVVTWPAMTLTNGASANFTVSLIAPASGNFTNIALATSSTPDPNLTNNNGSAVGSKVRTSITPVADVIVLLSGPTNVNVEEDFSYTIVVTNGGPSTASNVVTSDTLPVNLVFVSASSGGIFSNGIVTWPKIISLAAGGSTNYILTVIAPGAGQFTNVASALASTLDLDLTNNNGTLPASQVQTTVAPSEFALLSGAPVFNPQTGLFEESVTVTNIGSNTVAGFQLYVGGLRSGVSLYNATGTNGGMPFVQYNLPVDPSNTASMILEFYDPSRLPFTNTLSVVAIIPPNTGTTGTNGSVAISKIFTDTRLAGDTRTVIEFATIPGDVYTIIYSDDDMATWKVATPSITASANVTQWYDDGPPETDAKPTSRFYRVIQN